MQRSKGEKIFEVFNIIFMIIICILTLYPLWYVFVASFSSGDAVTSGRVVIAIKDFTFEAYKQVFRTKNIWTSYGNTILCCRGDGGEYAADGNRRICSFKKKT
jgi:putative aldouronate transport system permease protein